MGFVHSSLRSKTPDMSVIPFRKGCVCNTCGKEFDWYEDYFRQESDSMDIIELWETECKSCHLKRMVSISLMMIDNIRKGI